MLADRARVACVCDVGIAGDDAIVAVVGALAVGGVTELDTAVEAALAEQVTVVDIDLRECHEVDLSGAVALERAVRRCAGAGVTCVVRGADRFVRHLVEGLALDVPLR